MDFYKLSEKDFIKDDYGQLVCVYNGYKIEIEYSEESQEWCVDAFDLKAEQYVFYPCLSVLDRDKTRLNEVIQQATKYIDEKNKSKCREEINDWNINILIYIKNTEE